MNLSGHLILVAAVVSVFFAQQSEANACDQNNNLRCETLKVVQNCTRENLNAHVYPFATLAVENGFTKAINRISLSEDIITDGISIAKNLILVNPKAAKEILQQAYMDCQNEILKNTSPTLSVLGQALALSNEGAKQGMDAACKYSQAAGLSLLNSLNVVANLFNLGLEAEVNSKSALALLDAGQSAVETGYATCYQNIQIAVQKAAQALKSAQGKPMQEQAKSPNCESAEGDAEASDAIEDIDEAAVKSLQRGANSDIIQKLVNVLKCSVNLVANIANKAILEANSLAGPAEKDPLATKVTYVLLVDAAEELLHGIVANIYLALGEAGLKSGSKSNSQIGAAIATVAIAESEVGLGLRSAKELVNLGVGHPGNLPELTFAATAKIGSYCKLSLIQAIVKSADIAFSVL